jgi:hypothetical protein
MIRGLVVNALNLNEPVENAQVAVFSVTHTTGADGAFTFRELPAGTVTLNVTFTGSAHFQPAKLVVPTTANRVTRLTVAVVPDTVTMPDSVAISPKSVQVDVGSQVTFTAVVTALGAPSAVKPSFALTGQIGDLSAAGVFFASKLGNGTLTAYAGAASDTATVEVVAPKPPQLGTLSVSPTTFPPEGGSLRVAVTALDGDGIVSVVAQFDPKLQYPSGAVEFVPLALETGTQFDGSWAAAVNVPANNNPTDATGHQATKTYSVRVTASDAHSEGTTSQWVDIVVAGLEPPPPPPSSRR